MLRSWHDAPLTGEQRQSLDALLARMFPSTTELWGQLGHVDPALLDHVPESAAYAVQRQKLLAQLEHEGRVGEVFEQFLALPGMARYWVDFQAVFAAPDARDRGIEGPCPYPGLLAFSAANAEDFFGREAETAELGRRLSDCRWLSLEGQSGVGKSSLLHAGLLPRLQREGWRAITLRPGSHPWDSLTDALWLALPAEQRPARDAFQLGPQGLRDHFFQHQQGGRRLILVIDQLEELVTFAKPEQALQLAEALARALTEDTLPFLLITTTRSDFIERLLGQVPALGQLLNRRWTLRYVIGPMTVEALRGAVVGPAIRHGFTLEPGLAERICEHSACGRAGGTCLPAVAHALRELWLRCVGQEALTHKAYEELGGVEGALTSSAEHTLKTIKDEFGTSGHEGVRRLFTALAVLGGRDQAARRTLSRAKALDLLGGDEALLARLSGGGPGPLVMRLLTTCDVDPPKVELIHDTLLSKWTTLRAWLRATAEQKRQSEALLAAALEWDRHGRDPAALPGPRMSEAHLSADPEPEQEALQRDFKAALAAKDAKLRRDDAWRRRKNRWLIGLSVVTTVLLALYTLQLFRNREDLQDQLTRNETLVREKDAVLGEKDAALEDRDTALKKSDAALEQAREAKTTRDAVITAAAEALETLRRENEQLRRARTPHGARPAAEPTPQLASVINKPMLVERCRKRRLALLPGRAERPSIEALYDCWAATSRLAGTDDATASQMVRERDEFIRTVRGDPQLKLEARRALADLPPELAWRAPLLRALGPAAREPAT